MKKIFSALVIIVVLLHLFSCTRKEHIQIQALNNWQFKNTDSSVWFSATIPGVIHTHLLNNGIIEDPYFANNENNLQWIGESDWEYKTSFAGDEIIDKQNIELVFEGLDTYAEVYLNDSNILFADNMFRSWNVNIKSLIKENNNELIIRFLAPEKIEKMKADKLEYSLPDMRGFTRKAPYHYGWDWGPKFLTCGIWRPVYIRTWEEARIDNIQIVQKERNKSEAFFSANIEIVASENTKAELAIILENKGFELVENDIELKKGQNSISVDFVINDPVLWWPSGLGEQYLYDLSFELETSNYLSKKSERIGIREVELIREADTIGESFYFKVNGQPVFMKGANYIPQNNFLPLVSDQKYKQTIQSAVDANMNMLRVWGGGIYEEDIFYNLCDEMGILVWQDFMFACNLYPGDEAFLKNVEQEAIQNVKRIRNHPSIAIWCGNNEVNEGWFNWGWQKSLEYSPSDSLEAWESYLKLFEGLLPNVIQKYDPQRAYWPSSPKIGWGHEEAKYSGDMHYWGVWWGEEPFEIYEDKVGRFMTEYGFQAFPDLKTLDSCLSADDLNLASASLKNHQKHPRGMELIQAYMLRDYPVPDDFEQYIYISQLVQAYGIKTALEAHRRAKPDCMGTLYWQLNDCWPVISWSSVDYYNRWKALHYFAKKAYEDILISFEEENEKVKLYIVSDKLQNVTGNLAIKLLDVDGNKIWEETTAVNLPANSSEIYFEKTSDGFNKSNQLLHAELKIEDKVMAENFIYFSSSKNLDLPEATILHIVTKADAAYVIELRSDKLAKNVYLSTSHEGFFSDNYFDLMPGVPKKVQFLTNQEIPGFSKELKILCLNQISPTW